MMMRSLVFTGPVYPPEWVMRTVKYIRVTLQEDDILVVNQSNGEYIACISNINISSGIMRCTARFKNPVTGIIYEKIIGSDTGEIGLSLTSSGLLYSESGEINISPCCFTDPGHTQNLGEEEEDIVIYCTYPVTCAVDSDSVRITIEGDDNTVTSAGYNDKGITSINGVTASGGDIAVTGVGSVTITVSNGGGTKE